MTTPSQPHSHDLRSTPESYLSHGNWEPNIGEEARGLVTRKLPEDQRSGVLAAAASILGRGVRPSTEHGRSTGLVIGYVQSGKTLSFTTVAALARDNGFRMVIVIAGASLALLHQSTERLKRDLRVGEAIGNVNWRTYTNPNENSGAQDAIERALLDWDDEFVPADERPTVLITVMKNHSHLNNLNNVLQQIDLTSVPVLIIDDEADQASLNTLINRHDQSTTYRRVCELRNIVPLHTFLQYTATPQAPLLINIIDELSPDFVEVIEPGSGYIGGRDFFSDQGRDLTVSIPSEDIPSNENLIDAPPQSLIHALQIFLVGVAVGFLQGRRDENPHRSMLVHPSQATNIHWLYRNFITSLVQEWERAIQLPATDPDRVSLVNDFSSAYQDLQQTVDELPDLDLVLQSLPRALRDVQVEELNSTETGISSIEWSNHYSWILIGGQALDRGFTVEGLTVSYMPRGIGVGNADAIQQRGRFFGYKASYIGLCRVYLDQEVLRAFERYVEHEENMRRSLQQFSQTGEPLTAWKRIFFLDPALQPCRDNVIMHRYARFNQADQSGGWVTIEAVDVPDEVADVNNRTVTYFIESLTFSQQELYPTEREAQQHLVCHDVPLAAVIDELLTPFRTSNHRETESLLAVSMQLAYALEQNPEESVVVYHMRPDATSNRTLNNQRLIAQIFQGPTRAPRGSSQEYTYPGDRLFRDDHRISIQIHYFDIRDRTGNVLVRRTPVIAVFIPEGMRQPWLVQEQPGQSDC